MTTAPTIGIDLGTTHTVAAAMNAAGHTEILRTREGETLIPSVVLLADDRTIVGREAQLRGRAHPERLAACAKRDVGRPFYDQPIGGQRLPPEVIQACLLRQAATEWLGRDADRTRTVIAVPAHFNETQRHATATAAEIAGLHLLDLVNEPLAAALAFAEFMPGPWQAGPRGEPGAVLVFDLGGYTFEATVLSVAPGQMTMVATDHDSFLGGHDWDLRLADRLAESFIRQHGLDPRETPEHLEHLLQRAAQVKHALGVRSHTAVHLAFGAARQTIKLTRDEFEHLAADLVQRTGEICERVLQRAGVGWDRLQQVLLVGGATQMPMIRRLLQERLGREPDNRVCPAEAVARGAAIYAARALHGGGRPPALQVTSTSTHSLGIAGVDQQTGRHVNKVLIPRGTPLPAKVTREFATKSNAQHAIVFSVLEGEDPSPRRCATIGRVLLRDLPSDISEQWPVEVTYEYSASGRLSVDAHVRYTNSRVHLETVRPAGVSDAHVARWKEVVAAQAGFAAYEKVRAWERAAEAPPPVVVAGLPTATATAPPPGDGVLAFLRRMMPFVFRRSAESESGESAAGSGSADTPDESSDGAPAP